MCRAISLLAGNSSDSACMSAMWTSALQHRSASDRPADEREGTSPMATTGIAP